MNLELKKLSTSDLDDFTSLITIFEDVFEMNQFNMPDGNYLQHILDKPDFFAMVAKVEGRVAGGLTVYILHQYYSAKPLAYIYDLGVTPDFQRKGMGKKLFSFLLDYCRENGFEAAYVEAETDDANAVDFYRTTGVSRELQGTHFTYSF